MNTIIGRPRIQQFITQYYEYSIHNVFNKLLVAGCGQLMIFSLNDELRKKPGVKVNIMMYSVIFIIAIRTVCNVCWYIYIYIYHSLSRITINYRVKGNILKVI